jgi:hypothetical protein
MEICKREDRHRHYATETTAMVLFLNDETRSVRNIHQCILRENAKISTGKTLQIFHLRNSKRSTRKPISRFNHNSDRERIGSTLVRIIYYSIIVRVLGPACSTEFLRYSHRFLAFFAIVHQLLTTIRTELFLQVICST